MPLHEHLVVLLGHIRQKRNFNAKEWIDKKTDMFNDYMRKCGLKACVVSVSGGIDSAVTAGLMLHASKKPESPIQKVLGIAQPIHSSAWAYERALETSSALGFEFITIDQTTDFDNITRKCAEALHFEGSSFAKGQMRSYMRTPVNYYVAQSISSTMNLPCIVVGTGNYDEDGYLRYFCKAGDGVCDVQLIADLHKSEVFAVGALLGIPQSTLIAPPSADLWEGQTDEGELGFSYDFVELFTEYLKLSPEEQANFKNQCSEEGWKEFRLYADKAEQIHRANAHKAHFPVNLNLL